MGHWKITTEDEEFESKDYMYLDPRDERLLKVKSAVEGNVLLVVPISKLEKAEWVGDGPSTGREQNG